MNRLAMINNPSCLEDAMLKRSLPLATAARSAAVARGRERFSIASSKQEGLLIIARRFMNELYGLKGSRRRRTAGTFSFVNVRGCRPHPLRPCRRRVDRGALYRNTTERLETRTPRNEGCRLRRRGASTQWVGTVRRS